MRTVLTPSPVRAALALLLGVLLTTACARLGLGPLRPEEPPLVALPPVTAMDRALALLEDEAFAGAEEALRAVASLCESGQDGRRALLLLSALWIDPRNHGADADSAAFMAARYLALPDADALERSLAESLYLVALDLGADPALRPRLSPGREGIQPRFSDCAAEHGPEVRVALPVLGRESRAGAASRLQAERDSLAARTSELVDGQRALERRVTELEAELQRIRRLLGADPDTASVSRPGLR